MPIQRFSSQGEICPLCRALEQNRELGLRVSHLQFDLLVSETELLLDFDETGEKKIFLVWGRPDEARSVHVGRPYKKKKGEF